MLAIWTLKFARGFYYPYDYYNYNNNYYILFIAFRDVTFKGGNHVGMDSSLHQPDNQHINHTLSTA